MEKISIETILYKMLLCKSSLREGVKHMIKTNDYVDFDKVNMVI